MLEAPLYQEAALLLCSLRRGLCVDKERKDIDWVPELAFLNAVLEREYPDPGQFVMLYGRRVGKTAHLHAWAEQSSLLFTPVCPASRRPCSPLKQACGSMEVCVASSSVHDGAHPPLCTRQAL